MSLIAKRPDANFSQFTAKDRGRCGDEMAASCIQCGGNPRVEGSCTCTDCELEWQDAHAELQGWTRREP